MSHYTVLHCGILQIEGMVILSRDDQNIGEVTSAPESPLFHQKVQLHVLQQAL